MATEFVGIELQLMGAQGVRSDLEEIDRILNSFRGRKKFDAGLNEARKQVVAYKGELERLKRAQADTEKGSDAWNEYADAIEEVRQKLWNAQQAVREFGLASRMAGKTFMQTFNSISSKVAHVGSAMQSFGNALTTLTSPFGRLTDGMIFGAGYKVLNQFTEGIENGFERADVMRKYPRIMQNLGYSAEEAQASIDKLDKSVLGLPTSLVDMVSMSQRFTSTLGDLSKGTDIAIAANNAFLASMSSEQQQYQGMMQLQDLIGGKDMNAREWYSLAGSMMPAIRMIGESLGYTGKELDDYIARVQQGKVANKEFLDALVKAGTDENGKIRQVALQSLDTWEAFFSRVKTAASKFMFKGILEPMNDLVKTVTGGKFESLNLFLDDLIYNRIDKMGQKVKDWINAHPEEITQFFKDLSSINWGNFARGFVKGLGTTVKLLELASKVLSKFGMTGFGWLMGSGRGFGKAFTVLGGFLKGTRHIWAGLFTLAKFGGRRLGAGGIFGKIASLFGKKKDIAAAGEAAKEIPTVASTMRSALKSLEGLMKVAGGVAIIGFTGFVAFRSVKTMVKDVKSIVSELRGMDETDLKVAAGVIGGMTVFFGAMAGLGKVIGNVPAEASLGVIKGEAIVGTITAIAAGFAALDTELIKTSAKNFSDTIGYINSAIEQANNLPELTSSSNVISKLTRIRDDMWEISDVLEGKNGGPIFGGEYSRGMPTLSSGKANGIANISKAIKSLQNIVTNINALANMGINVQGNVVSKVKEIGRVVDEVIKAFPTWSQGGISGPKNLNANAKNFANALIGIRRMAYHINKLAGTDVNTSGFAAFVQQLKAALESLKDIEGDLELDIRVKLAAGFQKSVSNTIKSINNAKTKISGAAKKGLNLTIPVHVTFSLSTNFGGIIGMIQGLRNRIRNAGGGVGGGSRHTGVQPAMGGYIYRAGGGSVPWKRRGSDIVPAMLTPGEYVHNRRAVSTFGIDFMRKVNNLDMKGAMNELMHRAGGMANINRGRSVINNYNNNQKVVINNNGNPGAGFTFKSASRFVGAF